MERVLGWTFDMVRGWLGLVLAIDPTIDPTVGDRTQEGTGFYGGLTWSFFSRSQLPKVFGVIWSEGMLLVSVTSKACQLQTYRPQPRPRNLRLPESKVPKRQALDEVDMALEPFYCFWDSVMEAALGTSGLLRGSEGVGLCQESWYLKKSLCGLQSLLMEIQTAPTEGPSMIRVCQFSVRVFSLCVCARVDWVGADAPARVGVRGCDVLFQPPGGLAGILKGT